MVLMYVAVMYSGGNVICGIISEFVTTTELDSVSKYTWNRLDGVAQLAEHWISIPDLVGRAAERIRRARGKIISAAPSPKRWEYL